MQVYGVGGTSGSATSSFTNTIGYGGYPYPMPTAPSLPTTPPLPTVPPISGIPLTSVSVSNSTPVAGAIVSAQANPSGATANYTWYRDSVSIGTGQVYATTLTDVGHVLMVVATGTGSYMGSASAAVSVQLPFASSSGVDPSAISSLPESSLSGYTVPDVTLPVYSAPDVSTSFAAPDTTYYTPGTDTGAGNVGGGSNFWSSGY